MEKLYAVYHWWDEDNDSPAYANLRAPIIVSIATLRAVYPDLPILVLDAEDKERDWAHFPEKLNFSVKKIKPNLADCSDKIRGWKHLSRIYDVHLNTPAENVMYVDSDVFWFEKPAMLGNKDKFCFNTWNTGFYYYNRYSEIIAEFLKIFTTYTRAGIYSTDFKNAMLPHVGYDSWHGVWDEMVCSYMVTKHPALFDKIAAVEHGTAKMLHETGAINVNMFHANGTMVSNKVPKTPNEEIHCRGLLGILVKEFYDNLLKVLDEDDIRLIYSPRELSYYLPQQFPIRSVRWGQIKSEDRHYHIEQHLAPRKMII